jgi:hypothetical protein
MRELFEYGASFGNVFPSLHHLYRESEYVAAKVLRYWIVGGRSLTGLLSSFVALFIKSAGMESKPLAFIEDFRRC